MKVDLPSVAGNQQRVEEAIFASFECRHTISRLQVHKIDVHSVTRQTHQVFGVVQTEVWHLLIHYTFERDLNGFWLAEILTKFNFSYLELSLVEVNDADLTFAQNSKIEFVDRADGRRLRNALQRTYF